jgi:hypothetical protein
MFRKYIVDTFFNATLYFFIGDKDKTKKAAASMGLGDITSALSDADAVFIANGNTFVIWLSKPDNALLVHEASHFAVHVVRTYLMMTDMEEAMEVIGYLLEDVFRKASRKMHGKGG